MNIKIASLKEVVDNIDFIKRNNINLISIRDNDYGKSNAMYYEIIDNAGLQNILAIHFDDLVVPIAPQHSSKFPQRPPDLKDIMTILEWAKQKMKENKNPFIVHCTAGISRSSAVAILINYLQDPDNAIKVINPMLHYPNKKILEIGEQIFNTNKIIEPTEELLNEYDLEPKNPKMKLFTPKIKLWLDDERNPKDPNIQQKFGARGDEIWVKTVEEAIGYLERGNVTSISFDNDLGEGLQEGYQLAKWIEEQAYNKALPKLEWNVHSQNPSASTQIAAAMTKANEFWSQK